MMRAASLLVAVVVVSGLGASPYAQHKMVTVPNLIGMTVPKAEAVLADVGLKLGEVIKMHSSEEPGIVIGQGPGRGKRVMVNYEVKLYVSRGLK